MLMAYSATITNDGSGNSTTYIGSRITGRIQAIHWAHTDITSCPFTITGETTGVPIMIDTAGDADEWYYPRAFANKTTDGAQFTNPTEFVRVLKERIKVVVASGTASKSGTLTIYVDEDT
jgi:hypothetical protein